jgi:tRNA nucleotidyltransferase (CCA-adding enzyme)
MPRNIEEGFRDLLAKLTPTAYESEAAKSHRASIKTRLELDFGYVPRFTRIGSCGNGTSISGYSDVDYLACLPTNQLTEDSDYSLQKVRNSLDGRFPQTGVCVRCPAVVCPFGSSATETTDVVPADYVKESGGYKIYDIANCSGGWMKTSPDAHNEYVRSVDNKLNNKVKSLIRFIKAWKYFRDVPISSFYLELRVASYASYEKSIVFDIDAKQFLVQLRASGLADMQDPMGVSGLIPACKSDALYLDAISKLDTAAARAEKAREETAKGNISNAFDNWRLLYNYEFPTYYY